MFTRVQLIAFCLLLTATRDRAAAASLVAAAESRIRIANDLAGLRLLPTRRLLTSDTDTSAPEAASEESVPEEQLPVESEVDYDDYEADEDSEEDSTDVEDCDLGKGKRRPVCLLSTLPAVNSVTVLLQHQALLQLPIRAR